MKGSIDAAVQMKAIQPELFEWVIVDDTVQPKAGDYAHACQFKRFRKVLKRQKTVLGRPIWEAQRKQPKVLPKSQHLTVRLKTVLQQTQTLRSQTSKGKWQALCDARPRGLVHLQG